MKEIDELIIYTYQLENKLREYKIVLENIKSQLEDSKGSNAIMIEGINLVLENGE